jgi:hypothetical protein
MRKREKTFSLAKSVAYPVIVARHVHAARLLLALALLKVKLVGMRQATAIALFRTTRVVETNLNTQTRKTTSASWF